MASLKVSAELPASPVQSSGKRTEKLPRLNAVNALSNCFSSTWLSPLNREPFAGRTRETGVDFFITNQENDKSEKEARIPIANFDSVRMSPINRARGGRFIA